MRFRTFVLSFVVLAFSVTAFAHAESKWTTLDGNKIHYLEISHKKNADAIVLIHGWTCNADFWKDNKFPGYRVIAIDLPGHGKSDKPKLAYTMEHFARAVESVMKHAGIKKGVLIGHSMGTPVARQFYRLYPAQTLGIVAVDGALISFFPKEAMDQFFAPLKTDYPANAAKFIDGMLVPVKDEALKKFIRDNMLQTPAHVGISAMEGMADEKIWTKDKVDVPVLAVMAQTPFWPKDVKEQFATIAPKIDFQMWTDVSHFLHMEKPKEFNETVIAFIVKNKLL